MNAKIFSNEWEITRLDDAAGINFPIPCSSAELNALTAQQERGRQIAEVEGDIAWLRGVLFSYTCEADYEKNLEKNLEKKLRILSYPQARLAELKKGMKP